MKKLFLLMSLVFATLTTNASHLLGGYLQTYQIGSTDTLYLEMVLFSDPQGISLPTTLTLNEYKLTNGFYQSNSNVSVTKVTTSTWQGVNVSLYNATITRTNGDYRWVYTSCCRGMHTNATSSMNSNFTIGIDYQKSNTPNSTPLLLNMLPVNWVLNDTAQSVLFVVDVDGDSVMIEKDDALNQYANGVFVPLSPFNQLDVYGYYYVDVDGTITWVPNTNGQFATGYKITEVRNGQIIGVNRVQQVYMTQSGSTPSIPWPFVQVNHDLVNGDSTEIYIQSMNATSTELFVENVSVTQTSDSTWSLVDLQVGTYRAVARVSSNSSNMDYPFTFKVLSTIGIEENILHSNMEYKVYDWYGKYMGNNLENQKGFRILHYENGDVEKVFIQ